jgi:hypothetical protein
MPRTDAVLFHSPLPARALVTAMWVLFAASAGCGGDGDGTRSEPGSGDAREEETLVHLEARTAPESAPGAHASYQKKRVGGQVVEELEIQVEKAPSGVTHAVMLDGREIGRLVTDLDGEAEIELGGPGRRALPEGQAEPKSGSELRIGELLKLRLQPLERLVHLEAIIAAGRVSGKASYKVERLGTDVAREFKLKLSGLPGNSAQAVRLDDVAIGNLEVDSDGKAKLEFSPAEDPFPEGFPEVEPGSSIRVGQLLETQLLDRLSATPHGGG